MWAILGFAMAEEEHLIRIRFRGVGDRRIETRGVRDSRGAQIERQHLKIPERFSLVESIDYFGSG